MKSNLSFTSGLLLVIMCAILCAGLCFSIVLFEDHLAVASAFSYSDVTWTNFYSLSSTTGVYNFSSNNYSFNAFYVEFISNITGLQATINVNRKKADSSLIATDYGIYGYSSNFWLSSASTGSTSIATYGCRLCSSSTPKGIIFLCPYGINSINWNIASNVYCTIYLGNITVGSGEVDPSEYVTIEEYEQLQADYESLHDDLDELQDSYDTLSLDYADLQSNYQSVLDMNSDYATNLSQKTAALNIMINNIMMLSSWVNGHFINSDEPGSGYQYETYFYDYMEDLGYDLENVSYEDFDDVIYSLKPVLKNMWDNYHYYEQFYEDYELLLQQHEALQGQYDSLVDSLNFTSKSLLTIDKIENYPGTTSTVSSGYILAANTTGEAKIRYNLGVTISPNSEILLEYDFETNIYGYVSYPIVVNDGHQDIITFSSGADPNTFTYTPTYSVSYFIISAQNPVSTDASVFLADISVQSRSFDLSVVIANAYQEGVDSVDTQKYIDQGYTTGYESGYDAAGRGGIFLGLMTSVVDAPVQVLNGMFDFNILGINVKQFFYALISIALVIAIVKFCIK